MEHLPKKMVAISAALRNVRKNGRNDFQKYAYVRESDVVLVVSAEMAEHGVAFFPEVLSVEPVGDHGVMVHMRATFVDAESGESVSVSWYGEGQDKGDKATAKAITAATKTLLMKTFLISQGDDNEATDADGRPTDRRRGGRPSSPSKQPPAPKRDRSGPKARANKRAVLELEELLETVGCDRDTRQHFVAAFLARKGAEGDSGRLDYAETDALTDTLRQKRRVDGDRAVVTWVRERARKLVIVEVEGEEAAS